MGKKVSEMSKTLVSDWQAQAVAFYLGNQLNIKSAYNGLYGANMDQYNLAAIFMCGAGIQGMSFRNVFTAVFNAAIFFSGPEQVAQSILGSAEDKLLPKYNCTCTDKLKMESLMNSMLSDLRFHGRFDYMGCKNDIEKLNKNIDELLLKVCTEQDLKRTPMLENYANILRGLQTDDVKSLA